MPIINTNQKQFNPQNERIKFEYRKHLTRIKRSDEKTLKVILQHIREFEVVMNFQSFPKITSTEASQYVDKLSKSKVSLSYLSHNVRALNQFFLWLQGEADYRNKIEDHLSDYFSLSNNQRKRACAPNYRVSYDCAEIETAIDSMPTKTLIERRNRAIISLQYLCGLRISELRTLPIKNIKYHKDAENHFIYVDPKVMDVKFAKTRCAFFMPFGEKYIKIILNWKNELETLGFTEKAPLFPAIPTQFNQLNLLEAKPKQEFIKSNSTIRSIFENAFNAVNLSYYCPHTFRHTIARWAERQRPDIFNAVRHSLGHSDIKTTFMSYGTLPDALVGRLLKDTPKEEK
jgi:site-specific recombinase XerD